MTKTFCLDFGNTRKKAALFHDDKIFEQYSFEENYTDAIQTIIKQHHPHRSILASVVQDDASLEQLLSTNTRFHKLGHQTKLSFTSPVSKPETIGADRLALAAAAVKFHGDKNNLVIGLGTCVTYNFINKYKEFLGGAISPGLGMRLRSMHEYTAKLPLVKADDNVPLIGYDTNSNILSGAVLGICNEIDGYVNSYREKFRNFNVLLTGGDTVYLASHLKNKIFADPELIYKGLYAISEANNT